MTGQRAARPPVWGQDQKIPTKRLRRLLVLLTPEGVRHEDGTAARVTRVRRAFRS